MGAPRPRRVDGPAPGVGEGKKSRAAASTPGGAKTVVALTPPPRIGPRQPIPPTRPIRPIRSTFAGRQAPPKRPTGPRNRAVKIPKSGAPRRSHGRVGAAVSPFRVRVAGSEPAPVIVPRPRKDAAARGAKGPDGRGPKGPTAVTASLDKPASFMAPAPTAWSPEEAYGPTVGATRVLHLRGSATPASARTEAKGEEGRCSEDGPSIRPAAQQTR